MLKITNLSVSIENKRIIDNLSLSCAQGSLHIIMGPNGSGKSSFAAALMGHPSYKIIDGTVVLNGAEITQLSVENRARAGLFLAFQYPYEIPGVPVFTFIKEAHRALTGTHVNVVEFKEHFHAVLQQVGLKPSFAERSLNDGFSGGEKKRLELAQLLMLQPRVAVLDEIDSGMDTDGIKQITQMIHDLRARKSDMVIVMITHSPQLVETLLPDAVHVLAHGTIVASGDCAVAGVIESKGYGEFARI